MLTKKKISSSRKSNEVGCQERYRRRNPFSLILVGFLVLSCFSCQNQAHNGPQNGPLTRQPTITLQPPRSTELSNSSTSTESAENDGPVIVSYPTLQAQYPWLNKIKDGGFLSGEPCGPPCFLGVTPGITTEQQVYQVLETQGIKANCEPYNNENDGGVRWIDCLRQVTFDFGYKTDIVSGLSFVPSETVLMKDVVGKYGYPDHVIVASQGRNANYDQIASALIFYDAFPMWMVLVQKTGIKYSIEENTQVKNIIYATREDYRGFDNQFIPWQGYGLYYCGTC